MTTLSDEVAVERNPAGRAHQHTVIWLHGLGADGFDLVPFAEALRLPAQLAVRQIFPHAPYRRVPIAGDLPVRAWYRFDRFSFQDGERAEDILATEAVLADWLRRERARLPPEGRLILGGFSQGGVMALRAGLAAGASVDAVVALSTYAWGALPPPTRTPIFMGHGTQDPVIPIEVGRASRDRLLRGGFDVSWHEYAMGHAICDAEIAALAPWLQNLLEG